MSAASAPRVCGRASGVWFKSSFSCGAAACVEIRFDGGMVSIRDSKYRRDPINDPSAEPVINLLVTAFDSWLAEVLGRCTAGDNGSIVAVSSADGTTTVRSFADHTELVYTPAEWAAFMSGVERGEFSPVLV